MVSQRCVVIGIITFVVIAIITMIVCLAVFLKPVPLADPYTCQIDEIPNSLTLQEAYFSLGYRVNIIFPNNNNWGYITSTMNFSPTKNTYEMKRNGYDNETQVDVEQQIWTLTAKYDYQPCQPLKCVNDNCQLITYSNYEIKETITQSIFNTLNSIYTQYNIYKNGTEMGVSTKISLIDTDLTITDLKGNVLATMTRSFFGSLLVDTWQVVNHRPDVIDNWLVAYIPAMVTIKKREYQSQQNSEKRQETKNK
jgi:hypothetical protein